LYAAAGVLRELLPELEPLVGRTERGAPVDDWSYALLVADALPRHRPLLRLAAVLQGVGRRAAAQLLVRLRFSNAQADRIAHLAGAGTHVPDPDAPAAEHRRWLARVGPPQLRDLARIWCARGRVEGALG